MEVELVGDGRRAGTNGGMPRSVSDEARLEIEMGEVTGVGGLESTGGGVDDNMTGEGDGITGGATAGGATTAMGKA